MSSTGATADGFDRQFGIGRAGDAPRQLIGNVEALWRPLNQPGLTRCSRWSAVNDGVPAGEPARLMTVPRNTLSAHLAAAIALDANLPSYQAVSGISGQRRSP